MRWAHVPLLLLIAAFAGAVNAQSAPLVQIVARQLTLLDFGTASGEVKCPAGYIPAEYAASPKYSYDVNSEVFRSLVDSNASAINVGTLSNPAQILGGGYETTIQNEEHHIKWVMMTATCLATAATTDNTFALVRTTTTLAQQTTGTAIGFCPSDFPVAVGGFSNADGRLKLSDGGSAPVWGTAESTSFLLDMPNGQGPPPTGWLVRASNLEGFLSRNLVGTTICGKVPGAQTFVYSTNAPQGAFGYKTPFKIFAPVPDGWTAIGSGFAGGRNREFWYAERTGADAWMSDGTIVLGVLQWVGVGRTYDSGNAEVRAFIARAVGNAPSSGARAAVAVVAAPKAAQPPTRVTVVEYYHAGLDHYFITGIADEITKLDNGTFVGWQRTGETFGAYAIGSSGGIGRRPVCRAYGNPASGLDSHFYSASLDECELTAGLDWLLEAHEVFQMDLPDPNTGACPEGGVPIYRVFNQRKDANHRYTTSIAIRNQMVARGGVAEGYGPNAVVLCGLP